MSLMPYATVKQKQDLKHSPDKLEQSLLPAQVSESPEIRDEQRRAKLIVVAKRSESEAAVFKADPTTTAIVARLHDLVLQGTLDRIISERGRRVPPFAIQLAPAGGKTDLILVRLQYRVSIQSKLSEADEGLPKRMCCADKTESG